MPYFSEISKVKLNTCHSDLIRLFNEVVKHFDCTIVCGHRGETAQTEAYEAGLSTLQWPDSKHNKMPSMAVDVWPYPIDWTDKERAYHFAGFVKGIAIAMGIDIRWGGDWDSDTDVHDQNFYDLPHFELRV